MAPIIITALFGALVNSVEPPSETKVSSAPQHSSSSAAPSETGLGDSGAGLKVLAYNRVSADSLQQWEIHPSDVRLDVAMKRWSEKAGYSFRWDADRYVLVSAQTVLKGTFESAVNTVLMSPGIRLSDYPLEACIYSNEPPLLRVTRLGDQTKECQP